ncbi:hypothetical protein [Micromonospora sp. NPDC050200]|uniref:hypothetical protein n=1 Tax=Micromonospora sp. NPDC050200 TaxID=3155664 RepID=UPI0033F20C2F
MTTLSATTLGRAALWVAAGAAATAAVASIPVVLDADGPTTIVETWRTYGLAVFAILFAVLARRPHASRGVWAAIILNKVALTVTAIIYAGQGGIPGSGAIIGWDGALALLLIAAFVLTRGWIRSASPASPSGDRTVRA